MARTRQVKKQVGMALRRGLNDEDAIQAAEAAIEEVKSKMPAKAGRQPGQIIGQKKAAYTYNDLVRIFGVVTFMPEETIPLTYNGVSVQAFNGIEMHVPACFKMIYDNHRKELRNLFKSVNDTGLTIDLGAGALPPAL